MRWKEFLNLKLNANFTEQVYASKVPDDQIFVDKNKTFHPP